MVLYKVQKNVILYKRRAELQVFMVAFRGIVRANEFFQDVRIEQTIVPDTPGMENSPGSVLVDLFELDSVGSDILHRLRAVRLVVLDEFKQLSIWPLLRVIPHQIGSSESRTKGFFGPESVEVVDFLVLQTHGNLQVLALFHSHPFPLSQNNQFSLSKERQCRIRNGNIHVVGVFRVVLVVLFVHGLEGLALLHIFVLVLFKPVLVL